MGKHFTLTAADERQGRRLYRADPAGRQQGGMVVIQEIFGVNHHIRAVCDRLAGEGYAAVAPALFDRTERDFECGYGEADMAKAFTVRSLPIRISTPCCATPRRRSMSSRASARSASSEPASAARWRLRRRPSCADCRRRSAITAASSARSWSEKPKCPVHMHFGETDSYIPMSDVEMIRAKQPQAEVYVYQGAGHGLDCNFRARKLPRAERQARLAALDGVPAEAHEDVIGCAQGREAGGPKGGETTCRASGRSRAGSSSPRWHWRRRRRRRRIIRRGRSA